MEEKLRKILYILHIDERIPYSSIIKLTIYTSPRCIKITTKCNLRSGFGVLERVNAAGDDASSSWLGLIRLAYASLNSAMTAPRQITLALYTAVSAAGREIFSFNDVRLFPRLRRLINCLIPATSFIFAFAIPVCPPGKVAVLPGI